MFNTVFNSFRGTINHLPTPIINGFIKCMICRKLYFQFKDLIYAFPIANIDYLSRRDIALILVVTDFVLAGIKRNQQEFLEFVDHNSNSTVIFNPVTSNNQNKATNAILEKSLIAAKQNQHFNVPFNFASCFKESFSILANTLFQLKVSNQHRVGIHYYILIQ